MPNPKHILVIRLSAMGDVAMSVPVLRAFTEQFPNVKITVLTKPFFKPFFRDLKNVEVFPADVKGKHKGVLGLYKLAKELKKLQIDAIADLHNVLRSNVLKVFLSGIPSTKINKGRKEKKALVSGKVFQQLTTTHQRYADVFEALGFKIHLSQPKFPKPVELNAKLQNFISKDKVNIGIAPFAAHKGKMYPLYKMEAVVSELSKSYNVLLFGSDEEAKILNQFETNYENVISLAGKLFLDEELDVISNLSTMIAMDSGNGHIAALLGVKVITIYGVTHPYAGFKPFNQAKDNVLLADRMQYPQIPTSVYGNNYPEDYENAAGSISVNTIVKKVKENTRVAKT